MQLIVSWLTLSLGLWASHKLISGFRIDGDWPSFLLIGALVKLLHFFFGWLLFFIFGIATLGIGFILGFLTRLLATAVVLKLADRMSDRFRIKGFTPALLSAAVLAVVSAASDLIMR